MNLKNKKIAIYGGTFNPIHSGHIISGFDVLEKFNYDCILYIPDNIPVHKNMADNIPPSDRMKMVELSIKGIKNFFCSDIEIKRGGLSFTYDTVIELKKIYDNNNKFGIIFGDDLLEGIHLWKNIKELQDISDLICLKRKNNINNNQELKINFFENRIIEISSTEIRGRIRNNLSVNYMVNDRVRKYIIKHNLYRNNNGKI
jgi:nicotinate-nucleotide adenylyltransferase